MELQLIDKEISEARLFRTSNNFRTLTGRDIADLLYLTSLSAFLMTKDSNQSSYAKSYIKQSTQYGPYVLFRSHATDLYLLAFAVNNYDSKSIKLKDSIISNRFLSKLNFNNRAHWQFFNKVGTGYKIDNRQISFFLSLERQLKISNTRYKGWRRLITDWGNLKYISRQRVVAEILQEFRRIAKGSEMVPRLTTMTKYKKFRVSDPYSRKPSTGRKVAGAVAGAAAGRFAGKKIAQRLGKDVDKYKKVGTGLGAIAGYWAGGRQRQK